MNPWNDVAHEAAALLRRWPDGKPVAWMSPGKERLEFSRPDTVYGSHTIQLYTAPPATTMQPLTEEALLDLLQSVDETARRLPLGFKEFARAIERAHGIGGTKP